MVVVVVVAVVVMIQDEVVAQMEVDVDPRNSFHDPIVL